MRRNLLVSSVVALGLGISGCGGGGGGDVPKIVSVAAVADATQAEQTARIELKLTYGTGKDARSTLTEGVIDFESGDEKVETKAERGAKSAAVIVAVDRHVYFGSTDPPDKGPKWVEFPVPDDAAPTASTMNFDPTGFVRELRTSASDFSETGTSKVHGEKTRTYSLDLRSGSRVLNMMMIPSTTVATASIDVDRDGRLRRLIVEPDRTATTMTTTEGQPRFPIPARAELQLWDFGTNVDLDRPKQDEIVQFDDPKADDLLSRIFDSATGDIDEPVSGDLPDLDEQKLSGPFARLAAGTWEDVSWEIWEAPTTDGRVCRTLELTPSPAGQDDFSDVSIPGEIKHGDRLATCAPRADLFGRGDPVMLLGAQYANATYWFMVGDVAPEISALDIELKDGRVIRVEADPATHIFTLFSRDELEIEEVRPDAGDKATITCEPESPFGSGIGSLNCSGSVHR
jgi:hypothetical protein